MSYCTGPLVASTDATVMRLHACLYVSNRVTTGTVVVCRSLRAL